MGEPVYKICDETAFQEAKAKGRFDGSADDLRDGFIHLSAAHQVAGTLKKYFVRREGLVLLTVDADELGEALRWETSRGGDLFPHLYGPLHLDHVLSVEPLRVGADGWHVLPEGVAG
jgi:uncharacterized protein (DUF952 family)